MVKSRAPNKESPTSAIDDDSRISLAAFFIDSAA
jgi:hypothetical protein